MNWCFGLVNKKLAEIFFEMKGETRKIFGHAFVKKSKYRTKREKKWIEKDIKLVRFTYRNGAYKGVEEAE